MKSLIFRTVFIAMTIVIIALFAYYLYCKDSYDLDAVNEIIQTIGVLLLCFHYSISYYHTDKFNSI